MKLPIIQGRTVYHAGWARPGELSGKERKGKTGATFEGHTLSVTTEPEAWIQIARMGSAPVWKLTGPGRFLDVRALGDGVDSVLRSRPDLVRPKTAYWVGQWDDEQGDYVGEEHGSLRAAEKAAEGYDEEEVDIEETTWWMPTKKLARKVAVHGVAMRNDATTEALVEVARDAGLDGLWWTDLLDVARHSAPRGGIIHERLHKWRVTEDER